MDTARPIYSISAVAKILGVPVGTLRTWEDRYALVVPARSPGLHRLFTREQVAQLKFVKSTMEGGASAADAHRILEEHLDGGESLDLDLGEASERLLILLAESDPYAAEFQEFFLKTEGYDVDIAPDYQSVEALFERTSPTLVVIELLISGGLGFDLCRTIKARPSPPLLLAVSSLAAQDRALQAGADAFLPKPLEPLLFVSTVRDLLGDSAFLAEPRRALR